MISSTKESGTSGDILWVGPGEEDSYYQCVKDVCDVVPCATLYDALDECVIGRCFAGLVVNIRSVGAELDRFWPCLALVGPIETVILYALPHCG